MIQKFIAFLNQRYPYRFEQSPIKNMRIYALLALIVWIMLSVFQPFGLDETIPHKPWVLLGFAVMTLLGPTLIELLLRMTRLRDYQLWCVWGEMLFILGSLLVITLFCFGFGITIGLIDSSLENATLYLFFAVSTAVFPVSLLVLWRHNRMLRMRLAEAAQMSQSLPAKTTEKRGAPKLTITNHLGEVALSLQSSQFLFAKAADNYVEVHYGQSESTASKLIRTTLSQVTEQLERGAHVFRCHRSFVIHLEKVLTVEVQAAGTCLLLDGTDARIPISRRRLNALKELLKHHLR